MSTRSDAGSVTDDTTQPSQARRGSPVGPRGHLMGLASFSVIR
jgi:hypothetical protein